MFEVGEYIMCGGHGVCRVVDITGNPIDRLDKERKYYILEPVFEKGSTIYTPVNNEKVLMRKIMDEKDAKELIGHIPEIETVWIKEEKSREQMYKEAIRTYDCQSLVRIIKTLYLRKMDRVSQGKKVLSSDEHYLRKAEELLYSEMSIALSIPKENVEEYITEEINKAKKKSENRI
ncbi:MAG: CarD family transcriptional regulator [Lachnospiraceae bacterium]|nr:CarD family transcriptional regulator [Lachnospiraceae bacterium]MDD6810691.1 CarD family transcriptional regulator [Lachnospiraceae bacterium]